MNIKFDCRYYNGYKPCGLGEKCEGCSKYSPQGKRILIIKLAAMGDVLRTTPILLGLKNKYEHLHITWITDKASIPLLKNNPMIDTLLELKWENSLYLMSQEFDLLLNFEKEKIATALAVLIKASKKMGFSQTDFGALTVFNRASEYALRLGLDNPLKFFQNAKTYPEIIFEMADLAYNKEEYLFNPSEPSIKYNKYFADSYLYENKKIVVGVNTGCGTVFKTKRWPTNNFIDLINSLYQNKYKVLLLGGPNEIEINAKIANECKDRIVNTGCDNSLEEFIGIILNCDILVSSDSLAMHIGIALKKKVIALFGSTCPSEVNLFERGEKIVSDLSCVPCYKATCTVSPNCMEEIKASTVFDAIKRNS